MNRLPLDVENGSEFRGLDRFAELARDREWNLASSGDRNFLRAEWSYNNKAFRLKTNPNLTIGMRRNVDETSVLLGTWAWVGSDGKSGGPHRTVEDCLRDATRAYGLPPKASPRAHWKGFPAAQNAMPLRLVR